MSKAPPPVQNLMKWSEEHGFAATARARGDSAKSDFTLSDGRRSVHVNCTRGSWSVGVGAQDWSTAFSVATWLEYLDGVIAEIRERNLDEDVEFVTGRWLRAFDRLDDVSAAHAELERIDRNTVLRWAREHQPRR